MQRDLRKFYDANSIGPPSTSPTNPLSRGAGALSRGRNAEGSSPSPTSFDYQVPRSSTSIISNFRDIVDKNPVEVVDLDLSYDTARRSRSSPSGKPVERIRKIRGLLPFINVRRLDLSGNVISQVEGLKTMVRLESLNLSRNNIRGLTNSSLDGLLALTSLDLSGNFLATIGTCIGTLKGLKHLDMGGNKIRRLEEIKRLRFLPALTDLILSGNPICDKPQYRNYALFHCAVLEDLDRSIVTEQNRVAARRAFKKVSKAETKALDVMKSQQNKSVAKAKQLEDDNARLRTEVTVKSKLLNQKEQQWTTMAEELSQVKTELAFLKIDGVSTGESLRKSALEGSGRLSPKALADGRNDDDEQDVASAELASKYATRAELLEQKNVVSAKLDKILSKRRLLEHRLLGIASDDRQITENLARVSGGAPEPAPKSEEEKRMSLRNQQKSYERMKKDCKMLSACVEALQSKMDVTQDLLVARTEMMVIDDDFITLDMRALEERYEATSKLVADHIQYLDSIKKLSVHDLHEDQNLLSNRPKLPPGDLFDKGITMLTDELKTLQKQHKIATSRLAIVTHKLGQLEAAILSDSPSVEKKSLGQDYGDGNAVDAFCMRRANENTELYTRRLKGRLSELNEKRAATVAELDGLKTEEKEIRAILMDLENKELKMELDLSNQELTTRRAQVSTMTEMLQTGKVSGSAALKPHTQISNTEIGMPDLYDVPDYSGKRGKTVETTNSNGLSLAELAVGGEVKHDRGGENFKTQIAKGRRGSVGATQYHMALRQLLETLKHHRTLYGVQISNLNSLYDAVDRDRNGCVTVDELKEAFRRLGLGITDVQVDTLVLAMSQNPESTIPRSIFVEVMEAELDMVARDEKFQNESQGVLPVSDGEKNKPDVSKTKGVEAKSKPLAENRRSKVKPSMKKIVNAVIGTKRFAGAGRSTSPTSLSYENIKRQFFDAVIQSLQRSKTSLGEIKEIMDSLRFKLENGDEIEARADAMHAFNNKWPHGIIFPPDMKAIMLSSTFNQSSTPVQNSPPMAFGRREAEPSGRDSHIKQSPNQMSLPVMLDDFPFGSSGIRSRQKMAAWDKKSSKVTDDSRRLPWEVAKGDQLRDEFGSYRHVEKEKSPPPRRRNLYLTRSTASSDAKRKQKRTSPEPVLGQRTSTRKDTRVMEVADKRELNEEGEDAYLGTKVNLDIFKASWPKGKGKLNDSPYAEAEYQKMVIRHEAGALHLKMTRRISQTIKWE